MATILKNSIKAVSSTLRGLVATDASGVQHEVKYVRAVNADGVASTVYDTLKEQAFADLAVGELTYGDIPADGSAITPSPLTYSQRRTDIGHSGATYNPTTLVSGATIVFKATGTDGNPVSINAATGAIGTGSFGEMERKLYATVEVSVTLNGKTAKRTVNVYQEAMPYLVLGSGRLGVSTLG